MIKRIRFTPDAFEKYLDGLNDKFNLTILWNTLQGKSECGVAKSEKSYQSLAAFRASLMAQELGLNDERTSFYTKCLGAAFPPCGKEGEERLIEYALAHGLPYDEKQMMASLIEESFSQSGKPVVEGLREILLELFDEAKDSDVREIELAKLHHERMEILKALDRMSEEDYVQGGRRLDEKIDEMVHEIGVTACRKRLLEYKKELRIAKISMTNEEKEAYFKRIDLYKDYSGDECLINFILHETNPV